MGSSLYIKTTNGSDDMNRVRRLYIGNENNIAKKIKELYIGTDYGNERIFISNVDMVNLMPKLGSHASSYGDRTITTGAIQVAAGDRYLLKYWVHLYPSGNGTEPYFNSSYQINFASAQFYFNNNIIPNTQKTSGGITYGRSAIMESETIFTAPEDGTIILTASATQSNACINIFNYHDLIATAWSGLISLNELEDYVGFKFESGRAAAAYLGKHWGSWTIE